MLKQPQQSRECTDSDAGYNNKSPSGVYDQYKRLDDLFPLVSCCLAFKLHFLTPTLFTRSPEAGTGSNSVAICFTTVATKAVKHSAPAKK